ncbi:MAG: hypothetical protein A2460_08765 [Omnitrophica WOR_2 bacterium RIFOXYC2_FULL_43_9]|nr:MAG: hypothetical protein A2460_08765 [Omnitrophica WOR_2 bacterium RIFOXYC2_FULL_43_9]
MSLRLITLRARRNNKALKTQAFSALLAPALYNIPAASAFHFSTESLEALAFYLGRSFQVLLHNNYFLSLSF